VNACIFSFSIVPPSIWSGALFVLIILMGYVIVFSLFSSQSMFHMGI